MDLLAPILVAEYNLAIKRLTSHQSINSLIDRIIVFDFPSLTPKEYVQIH
jgi:hypothetical protein